MTTIDMPPAGHGHFFRFFENLFAPDRPRTSQTEDPVSFHEFLDRMVSLRQSGRKPTRGQRRRLEGMECEARLRFERAADLLRLGNPYQAERVLRALEKIDSDLARARARQIELDPDVARQVARLDEYRAAARAMIEYAGSFDEDPEGDVEWRTWIAAEDD
jgi:hypothetical protein